jgi:hypothetical protein
VRVKRFVLTNSDISQFEGNILHCFSKKKKKEQHVSLPTIQNCGKSDESTRLGLGLGCHVECRNEWRGHLEELQGVHAVVVVRPTGTSLSDLIDNFLLIYSLTHSLTLLLVPH